MFLKQLQAVVGSKPCVSSSRTSHHLLRNESAVSRTTSKNLPRTVSSLLVNNSASCDLDSVSLDGFTGDGDDEELDIEAPIKCFARSELIREENAEW